MWRRKNLTLDDKIITFLAQFSLIPNQIVDKLHQIQNHFSLNSSSPKVKPEIICKGFQYEVLKKVDIKSKIIKFIMLLG